MSDILPKIKLYILLSIINLIINLGTICFKLITTSTLEFSSIALIIADIGGSFVPFVSLVSIALMGLPTEVFALIGIFTGIISAVQTFIIAMMILSLVHNIIWNPDV
jgi:hypothetical protein